MMVRALEQGFGLLAFREDPEAIRQIYSLLPSEDPNALLDLMDELQERYRPRDELERHLVEDAALALFRERRATELEKSIVVKQDGADAERAVQDAKDAIDDYRRAAQRKHQEALHELAILQSMDNLPSADIIPFPAGRDARSPEA